jgi:DNA-binding IclR family transcriptional regulator
MRQTRHNPAAGSLSESGVTEGAEEVPTRSDGSIARIFDVLDLFSTALPMIRAEDVMDRLGYTKSTAYRYLKTLCDVGLLAQAGGAFYSLGPRIIELDRLMHLTDPLLQAGQQLMPALAEAAPNSIVLLSSLYRDRVLCVHKEGPEVIQAGGRAIRIRRARGLPLPLFQGAASLIILALLPAHRVRTLYLNRQAEIAEAGLAEDWKSFRTRLAALRREGHMVTEGQFNPLLAAVAVPIISGDEGGVRGSLTRILARADLPADGPGALVQELKDTAASMAAQLPDFSELSFGR